MQGVLKNVYIPKLSVLRKLDARWGAGKVAYAGKRGNHSPLARHFGQEGFEGSNAGCSLTGKAEYHVP
ncbi:hypothetical protein KDI_15540 [Dictyobacter arantiisoli]|uniref:Uncharacterized protein n=1 Tax=Dictyobacter arantiisoli TaxID=2014874 RepID=A0A5A5T926_9CHLR|nr:hypothetical protein KDI_15540 [Dictyobacter arantiisoli]